MINAGKLRERVAIESPHRETNSMGETVLKWQEQRRVWASVEGVSSKELLTNSRQEFDITHRVRMRYFKGLSNNDRLNWDGRLLQIISVLEHGNRAEHELICREAVEA